MPKLKIKKEILAELRLIYEGFFELGEKHDPAEILERRGTRILEFLDILIKRNLKKLLEFASTNEKNGAPFVWTYLETEKTYGEIFLEIVIDFSQDQEETHTKKQFWELVFSIIYFEFSQFERNYMAYTSEEFDNEYMRNVKTHLHSLQIRLDEEFGKEDPLQTPVPYGENTKLSQTFNIKAGVLGFSTLPSGTHKYIKSIVIIDFCKEYYKEKKAVNLMAITAGNYGNALKSVLNSLPSELHKKFKLIIFLDESASSEMVKKLEQKKPVEVTVLKIDLGKKIYSEEELEEIADSQGALISYQVQRSEEEDLVYGPLIVKKAIDITNTESIMNRRGGIEAQKISHQFPYITFFPKELIDFDVFICPFGTGELFQDLVKFVEHNSNGRKPKYFIPVLPKNHPFVKGGSNKCQSVAQALATPLYLPVRHTYIFSVLNRLNQKEKVKKSKLIPLEALDKELLAANQIAADCNIDSEVSGSAAIAALLPGNREKIEKSIGKKLKDLKVLIVNTGNGLKYLS